ncbi:transmembrane protein [Ceratobasidium sp. AG-Ba]|nr:transmembrane protein [Ceratobasidium sp. AG-Ba]
MDRPTWSGGRSSMVPTRREIVLVCCMSALFLIAFQSSLAGNGWSLAKSSANAVRNRIKLSDGSSILGGHSKDDDGLYDFDYYDVGQPESPDSRKPHREFSSHVKPHGPLAHTAADHVVADTEIQWTNGQVPETSILAHAPGWTIFDRLYMLNGTIYVVVSNTTEAPDRRMMTSSGYEVWNPPEEVAKREPTDKHMRIITPSEAAEIFGDDGTNEHIGTATNVQGVTFLVNDPPQFIQHYYHFSAELLFGLWRTYSSLDPLIPASGNTKLPAPRRFMFTHTPASKWRDYAKLNQYVLHSAFPSCSLAFEEDWIDRSETGKVHVFERVVFADRAASMRGQNFLASGRSASEVFVLPGSVNWWAPVRRNVLNFIGAPEEELIGAHEDGTPLKPVITYVSRQGWGRRMLKEKDHLGLVKALRELEAKYGYEVNIVKLDKMSRDEQLRLAGRTTIMMGVHGNGLTSLLWMLPSPRATVIEFFYPGGFAFDYEYTTRALGMTHYGFWGSDSFTSPNTPPVNYPEGFQGSEIPIDGEAVAKLVHHRLSMNEELDD